MPAFATAMSSLAANMPALLGFIDIGPGEMILVGIVAVLLFGKNLPEVGRNIGQGIAEFKKGLLGIGDDSSSGSRPAARPRYQDDIDDYIAPSAPKFVPPTTEPDVPEPIPQSNTPAHS